MIINIIIKMSVQFLLIFLILHSTLTNTTIFANSYPHYDDPYRPLIGGIQIQYINFIVITICSLAFPVNFAGKKGFVTAGHCGDEGWPNYVYQPHIDSPNLPWRNFIGNIVRDSPDTGDSIVDAAIIQLDPRGYPGPVDYSPFIFENRAELNQSFLKDSSGKVGIYKFRYPTANDIDKVVFYKSGRTTGVTWGKLKYIRRECFDNSPFGTFCVDPVMGIQKDVNEAGIIYSGPIADHGDSGGVVYTRFLYYKEFGGFIRQYAAVVYGIVTGGGGDWLYASLALNVVKQWPDVVPIKCVPSTNLDCGL
jgi:hypothetical protein